MSRVLAPIGTGLTVNINNGGGNGLSGSQSQPDVTTLSDGRFMVAYSSDFFGNAADRDPIIRIFNADGSSSTPVYLDAYFFGSQQIDPALAARQDGGAGLVFTNALH